MVLLLKSTSIHGLLMIYSSSRILAELNKNYGGHFDWIGIVLQAVEVDTIEIIARFGDQFR